MHECGVTWEEVTPWVSIALSQVPGRRPLRNRGCAVVRGAPSGISTGGWSCWCSELSSAILAPPPSVLCGNSTAFQHSSPETSGSGRWVSLQALWPLRPLVPPVTQDPFALRPLNSFRWNVTSSSGYESQLPQRSLKQGPCGCNHWSPQISKTFCCSGLGNHHLWGPGGTPRPLSQKCVAAWRQYRGPAQVLL